MQTTQVSNPANLLAAAKQPGKQADGGGADAFDQALSREVAGHDAGNAARAGDKAEARQPAQSAARQPEAKPAEKAGRGDSSAEDSEDGAESAPADAAQAQFSVDMLALVAAINSITGQRGDTPAGGKGGKGGDGALDLGGLAAGRAQASFASALQASGDAAAAGNAEPGADPRGAAGNPQLDPVLLDAAGAARGAGELAEAGPEFLDVMQDSAARLAAAAPAVPQAALQAARQAQPAASDRLMPAVGTPAWDQALGQKVVWMVAGEQQSASLTLNPPDLGPLQVVLSVSNSQASATFTAAQPEVRQALEAALPKLRDMLGEAGIQLGQASVNSGAPNQHGGADQPGARARSSAGGTSNDNGGAETQTRVTGIGRASSGTGLVDTFA